MNSSEQTVELAWQSFRYIAGEMDQAEHSAFEDRLAADQTSREVVAQVVELSQAVACAEAAEAAAMPATIPMRRPDGIEAPSRMHAVRWMATGAAACLACVLVVQSVLSIVNTGSQPQAELTDLGAGIKSSTADGRALIQAYQQLRAEELSQAELAATGSDDVLQLSETGDHLADEAASETEAHVPSWLLAAVSLNNAGNAPAPKND